MNRWKELPAKTQALITLFSGVSFLSIAIGLGIVFGPAFPTLMILVPLVGYLIFGIFKCLYTLLVWEFESRKRNNK